MIRLSGHLLPGRKSNFRTRVSRVVTDVCGGSHTVELGQCAIALQTPHLQGKNFDFSSGAVLRPATVQLFFYYRRRWLEATKLSQPEWGTAEMTTKERGVEMYRELRWCCRTLADPKRSVC